VFKVQEIEEPGTIFKDENVRVEAIENCHFHFPGSSPAAVQAKFYALRFETADKTVVFSGDTGACEPMVDFAKRADILVHEVISLDLYDARAENAPVFSATASERASPYERRSHDAR
jgi:ribonuclease BN (tRNA processing enzyme)